MAGDWESFFVAQVGASAALTGLVFVALSINLERIIGSATLVGRAGEAITLLILPVVVGLIALVPDLATRTTGAWILGVAVAGFVGLNRFVFRARTDAWQRSPRQWISRLVLVQVAILPTVIGGVVLLGGSSSGFDWVAVGAAASLVVGILDAWVLLVEILR